jgi:hypothetical protein
VYNKTVHPKPVSNSTRAARASMQAPAEVVEVVDIDRVTEKRTTTVNGLFTLHLKSYPCSVNISAFFQFWNPVLSI